MPYPRRQRSSWTRIKSSIMYPPSLKTMADNVGTAGKIPNLPKISSIRCEEILVTSLRIPHLMRDLFRCCHSVFKVQSYRTSGNLSDKAVNNTPTVISFKKQRWMYQDSILNFTCSPAYIVIPTIAALKILSSAPVLLPKII